MNDDQARTSEHSETRNVVQQFYDDGITAVATALISAVALSPLACLQHKAQPHNIRNATRFGDDIKNCLRSKSHEVTAVTVKEGFVEISANLGGIIHTVSYNEEMIAIALKVVHLRTSAKAGHEGGFTERRHNERRTHG